MLELDMRHRADKEEIRVRTPTGDVRITISARMVGIGLEGHGTKTSRVGRMDEIILLDLTGVEFGDAPILLVWDNIRQASWTQRIALILSREGNRREDE